MVRLQCRASGHDAVPAGLGRRPPAGRGVATVLRDLAFSHDRAVRRCTETLLEMDAS